MREAFRDIFGSGRVVSGEVLTVYLYAEMDDDGPFSSKFWGLLDNTEQPLQHEIETAIREKLGSAFELRKLAFARGSIEIIVIVGTGYYAISRYKNFIESVELFVNHLKSIVRRFFERRAPMRVSVSATWSPGPALVEAQATPLDVASSAGSRLFGWYLIVSHATMLAFILWLLARKAF